MKILIEATALTDPKKTGIPYFTQAVVKALSEHEDIEIDLIYTNFLNRKKIDMPVFGERVYYKKVTYLPGRIYRFAARKFGIILPVELLTLKKYDWIIFPNYMTMSSLRKTKKMVYIHDLAYMDHPEYLDSKNADFLRKIMQKVVETSDLIGTISNFTKERIEHYYNTPSDKIFVTPIPLSIEPKRLPITQNMKKIGIERNKYFLYVGTLEPRKNPELLLNSYLKLPDKIRKEYSLVYAGRLGWKMEKLQKRIEDSIAKGEKIILTNYISDNDLASLYTNAKSFILPSHYEGFGMPVMEALCYNMPVAVNDIPVFHEIFDEKVIYFHNKNTLSNVMLDVVSGKIKGQDNTKFIQSFSWNKVSKNIYQKLNQYHRG